ncbi:MAG TPA: sigma-70 family RNA polymerase sigma factor [Candidatus Desulfaltia sp.]|nr:sigma-70 family RNA polymerase sigma factor [Candidatus Desulfaltia sp.]
MKREPASPPTKMTPRQFDEIYDRYRADVFRFLFYLTRDQAEAEDLFQDVWLRVVRHGPPQPDREDLRPWLLTIVLNLHRDVLRKKRVRRLFLVKRYGLEKPRSVRSEQRSPLSADPANLSEQAALQRDIDQAMAVLPEKQRRVFLLSEVEGLPQAEIAGILEVPLGTVKSLLYRAVKRLQRELAAHNPRRERIKCDAKMLSV